MFCSSNKVNSNNFEGHKFCVFKLLYHVIILVSLLDKIKCGLNCRVGGGFWRRGGETPSTVKWEDRITEVREGSWSYVAGSIGRAPGMLFMLVLLLMIISISFGSSISLRS